MHQAINRSVKILKFDIKNFGKLTDAVIRISKFTVFAGPNNTGKSFACKALYSTLSAMDINYIAMLWGLPLESLKNLIRWMSQQKIQSEHLITFTNAVEELRVFARDASNDKGGARSTVGAEGRVSC